jgi:hypothetical protein
VRTYKDLQEIVLRYFDVANEEEGSADVVLVQSTLNTANATRSSEDKWKFMLSDVKTLSVVGGQQEYILPFPNLLKLHYIYSTTNKRFGRSIPMRSVPYVDVPFQDTTTNSQDVLYYDITDGGAVVQAQPTTADTLVAASSASEAADVQLYVEGLDANGVPISETIDAAATSTATFSRVDYYAKIGTWAGTLTLTTTGAEDLVTLSPTETGKEFPVIKFLNIPSASETFQYRYFRKPRVMSRDNDRPDLPYPHSNVLIYDALLDLATYNELDSESVNIWRDKQQAILEVLYQQKLEGDSVGGDSMYINELGRT